MKFEICKKCGVKVEMYDCKGNMISNLYSGGLCEKCYEEKFDKMDEQERKPDFTKIIK